jgi:hypothetical protein
MEFFETIRVYYTTAHQIFKIKKSNSARILGRSNFGSSSLSENFAEI